MPMLWVPGSGLGKILKGFYANSNFQDSATSVIESIGLHGLDLLAKAAPKMELGDIEAAKNVEAMQCMFNNLAKNAGAVVGLMVNNTAAQTLVDKDALEASSTIK